VSGEYLAQVEHLLLRHRRALVRRAARRLAVVGLDHLERGCHDPELHRAVRLLVEVERRPVVGLEEVDAHAVVDEHVNPDDLEAHARPLVVEHGRVVLEPQSRECGEHCLETALLHFLPDLGGWHEVVTPMPQQGAQWDEVQRN